MVSHACVARAPVVVVAGASRPRRDAATARTAAPPPEPEGATPSSGVWWAPPRWSPARSSPPPARAVDLSAYLVTDRDLDIPGVDLAALADPSSGWTTLDSGVSYIVDRPGEGNVERGILDTVDHYIPQPFVTVKYTAYTATDGRAFASTLAARRPYDYQAGVKDEVQDEAGGVMGMRVGETRRSVVPVELCFRRKCFGSTSRRARTRCSSTSRSSTYSPTERQNHRARLSRIARG